MFDDTKGGGGCNQKSLIERQTIQWSEETDRGTNNDLQSTTQKIKDLELN
jgi:hypothetical protein